jgi:hypothetical protein
MLELYPMPILQEDGLNKMVLQQHGVPPHMDTEVKGLMMVTSQGNGLVGLGL